VTEMETHVPGDPYIIRYPEIVAVTDGEGSQVELVEFFECTGGAMWAQLHYAKSPLVRSVRTVGASTRYILDPGRADLDLVGSRFAAGISGVAVEGDEIAISYIGLGGGGVGASGCRSLASGVTRSICDPSGGGKKQGRRSGSPGGSASSSASTTRTRLRGATWTLCHNIAKAVQDEDSRYLSHTIVQLFPVPYRTKNCVAVVCEFASRNPARLVSSFEELLSACTLSPETGMAVFRGLDPRPLLEEFGWAAKRGRSPGRGSPPWRGAVLSASWRAGAS